MPFSGEYPAGTPGGIDQFDLAQTPIASVTANGPMYILVMRTNGPLTERNRENVEDVIRVIGLRGESLAGFTIRHAGGILDMTASDLDFLDGFAVIQIAPGTVQVMIDALGVQTIMLADDAVTGVILAPDSVDGIALAILGVGTNDFANSAITAAKILNGAVDNATLASSSVDSSKIVDDSIVNADFNNAAGIAFSKLQAIPGMVLLASQSFTAQSSVAIDNVFTAAYDNYQINVEFDASSTASGRFVFRSSGSDYTTAEYIRNIHVAYGNGTHDPNVAPGVLTSHYIFDDTVRTNAKASSAITVFNPFATTQSVIINKKTGMPNGSYLAADYSGCILANTLSFDGFKLYVDFGTFTGTVSVYGYT